MSDALHSALTTVETDEGAWDREVPVGFVTGKAGVGKTFGVVQRTQEEPGWGLLCATTGIAAVNLGAVTVNSVLGYFDEASLRDAYLCGRLQRALHDVATDHRWLVIDEASMLGAASLDLLYRGVREANQYADLVARPLGLLLVGDFAQLPPVNAKWAFEADCWPRFAARTTRLDKVWRQADGPFLDALNLLRAGQGGPAAEVLAAAGARFETVRNENFDGTTIVPVNAQVSRHNDIALDHVAGPRFRVRSRRWGKQRAEWGLNTRTHEWGIPEATELKVGAYVMALANRPDFSVVNGDCGHVVQYATDGAFGSSVHVKLVRTGKVEVIRPIVRAVETSERPDGFDGPTVPASEDTGGGTWLDRPHRRARVRRWVLGQVEYLPLRLAYASSVHKSQSLTLDRVQVDYRHWFFGREAMLYVALSRCRSLGGLRLVGMRETFIKQAKVDARVMEWL